MRSGAKPNVAPDRHAQARRVAVRSASTEPAAAPRKVADSDMINLGKTGELSGRQHCDSVAWDILLSAALLQRCCLCLCCASTFCLTLYHIACRVHNLVQACLCHKKGICCPKFLTTLLITAVCADVRVPVIGLGAWAWGDRSGYWGYGQEYTQEESRRAYKVRMDNGGLSKAGGCVREQQVVRQQLQVFGGRCRLYQAWLVQVRGALVWCIRTLALCKLSAFVCLLQLFTATAALLNLRRQLSRRLESPLSLIRPR